MYIVKKLDTIMTAQANKSVWASYFEALGFIIIASLFNQRYSFSLSILIVLFALIVIGLLLLDLVFWSYWVDLCFYTHVGIWPIITDQLQWKIACHATVQERLLPLEQKLIIAAAHDPLSDIAYAMHLKIQTAEDIAQEDEEDDDGESWKQLLSPHYRRYELPKNAPRGNGRKVTKAFNKLNTTRSLTRKYDTIKIPNIFLYEADTIRVN